MAGYEMTKIT